VPKYRYTAQITVWKENFRSAGAVREQWEAIRGVMVKAANRHKWRLLDDGTERTYGSGDGGRQAHQERAGAYHQ
jgi:hypothetical protein